MNLLGALCAVGCVRRLPNLKDSEIHSRTASMGVVVEATATGVKVTETTLNAEAAEWKVSFPGFSHETRVKDYTQKRPREKDDKP
ncbi:MAG TPA: hypothetical protein VEC57_00030 [Candidatus Limnocylindrales bacterium]|nr:hypothetical protein [Candidatus Limnocylindrales bacterium]